MIIIVFSAASWHRGARRPRLPAMGYRGGGAVPDAGGDLGAVFRSPLPRRGAQRGAARLPGAWAAAGPLLTALYFDAVGDYNGVFLAVGINWVFASVLILAVRRPGPPPRIAVTSPVTPPGLRIASAATRADSGGRQRIVGGCRRATRSAAESWSRSTASPVPQQALLQHARVDAAAAGMGLLVHAVEVAVGEPCRVLEARRRVVRDLDQHLAAEAQPRAWHHERPIEAGDRHVLAGQAGGDRVALGGHLLKLLKREQAERALRPAVVFAIGLRVALEAADQRAGVAPAGASARPRWRR